MNASDITAQDNLNASQGLTGDRGATGPIGPPGLYGNIGPDGLLGPTGIERYDFSFTSYDKDNDRSYPYLQSDKPWYKEIAYFIFPGTDTHTPTTFSLAVGFLLDNQRSNAKLSYEADIYDVFNDNVICTIFSDPIVVSDYASDDRGAIIISTNKTSFSNLPTTESLFALRIKVIEDNSFFGAVTPTLNVYSFQMY